MSTLRQNPFGQVLGHDLPLERRWAVAHADERREYQRWPARSAVWLLDLEGLSVLRCQTDDLSQGGLHATVPIGYGLAVGQRYELRMKPDAPGEYEPLNDTALPPQWASCYGTIIRTRLLNFEGQHRLAFAVRFDSPQISPLR